VKKGTLKGPSLEFISELEAKRMEISKQISKGGEEAKIKLALPLKKVISLEGLAGCLSLLLLDPKIEGTQSEIEELMECYRQLDFDIKHLLKAKKQKREGNADVMNVLIDLLTSLLTK